MSACWSSSMRRGAPLFIALACLALAAPGPASAGSGDEEQGDDVKRVSIGSDGIVIERAGKADTIDTPRKWRTRVRHRRGFIEVDNSGDAVVRVFADAHVPADETVQGDVVAIFGSVEVEGRVEGDVVAVLGSVDLKPGASVRGDAVSIGGVLDQAEGVEVGGETVSVGFMPSRRSWDGYQIPAVPLTLTAIFAGWLTAIVTGWLLVTLFPVRTVRVAAMASRRTSASLLLGFVSLPMLVLTMFLLCVTMIGIPLAILLPPAYFLLMFAGQLAATYVLGCKLTGRRLGVGGLVLPLVAGTMLVAAFFGFGAMLLVLPGIFRPLGFFSFALGTLMLAGLTCIGGGAFLLSRLGSHPQDVDWTAAPPAVPAPGYAPPPAPTGV
jgi:hypothetical protein